jgi:hypothetical protein
MSQKSDTTPLFGNESGSVDTVRRVVAALLVIFAVEAIIFCAVDDATATSKLAKFGGIASQCAMLVVFVLQLRKIETLGSEVDHDARQTRVVTGLIALALFMSSLGLNGLGTQESAAPCPVPMEPCNGLYTGMCNPGVR